MLSLVFAAKANEVADSPQIQDLPASTLESFSRNLLPPMRSKFSLLSPDTERDVFQSPISNATPTVEDVSLYLDLSKNLLMVKRGNQVIHTALVATGSGKVLQDPHNSSRKWKFETPRGSFTIESKLEKPVWIRPDWAFIEKGLPVPKVHKRRLLPNALGDYALGFGDGYFIHGALYTYLLGFNVTHGCIQLNDEDLQYVFETVPIGASLVIM